MKDTIVFAAAAATLFAYAGLGQADEPSLAHKGRVITPKSSIERPEDLGRRARTHYRIFVPADRAKFGADPDGYAIPNGLRTAPLGERANSGSPPASGYGFETPASVACIYNLVAPKSGCDPNVVTANPNGGSHAIALVDAYDYPTAMSDLNTFSAQFGLPEVNAKNFQVVFAGGNSGCAGSDPGNDPDWELEQALDVQWAHAMAPNAKIFLVEAASSNFDDLLAAEDCASALVAAAGGGEVSNSWGGAEFGVDELAYDAHFTTPGIVYLASSGDTPGTQYPSVSPNVVAVGGTTVSRVNSGSLFGHFIREQAWSEGGGGISSAEHSPSYQRQIPGATMRVVPDVAAVANPDTGVWIVDSNSYYGSGWFILGGTSVASPLWAGVVNSAGRFATSSRAELTTIYNVLSNGDRYPQDFRDVTHGFCGPYAGDQAGAMWDLCTGVGSPRGYGGK